MPALRQLFEPEQSLPTPPAIEQAIEQYLRDPRDLSAWREFEESRAGHEFPEWVAKTYIDTLTDCEQAGGIPKDLLMQAFEYSNEWFGAEPQEQAALLVQLCKLAPGNDAIFDQCTVTLTHAQQWDDLLLLHDLRAEAVSDRARKQTLERAAQIALDFGRDAKRALGYYGALLEQEPNNERIFSLFVRLVTREASWTVYAEALAKRAPHLDREPAQAALLGRAQLLQEKLGDLFAALDQYAQVLKADRSCEPAKSAILQIAQDESLDHPPRRKALGYMFEHHRACEDDESALATVVQHIELIAPERELSLEHTRLTWLTKLGRGEDLARQSARLFLACPQDPDSEKAARKLLASSESSQRASRELLAAFEARGGSDTSVVLDLVLDAARNLVNSPDDAALVAQSMMRVLAKPEHETNVRQDAAALYEQLDDETRFAHETPEQLEMQVALAPQNHAKLELLARLATRADNEEQHKLALDAWQRVLELDPAHAKAQQRVEAHLDQAQNWDALAQHLEHRSHHSQDKEHELSTMMRLVQVELQERSNVQRSISLLELLLEAFPGRDEISTRYHDVLLEHQRFQEFVDWAKPRALQRRDASALIESGEVYLRHLSNSGEASDCVLLALEMRPDFAQARSLGLEILRQAPPPQASALAQALWRSFGLIEVSQEQLDDLKVLAEAMADPKARAKLWLQTEARFERGAACSASRLLCLQRALTCNPALIQLDLPMRELVDDNAQHAPDLYRSIVDVISTAAIEPDDSARLWDCAAFVAMAATDEEVGAKQVLDAHLRAWQATPTPTRHQMAIEHAIACEDWQSLVRLACSMRARDPWVAPVRLWSLVCQSQDPVPDKIPFDLVQTFESYLARNPGPLEEIRIEWLWNTATLLAHHQHFARARDLAMPLAKQDQHPLDPSRLRTLYAWLRMEPARAQEALAVADLLTDHLSLNVEERRAHAQLDKSLRAPGRLDLQLALWECCEATFVTTPGASDPAPLVFEAMLEGLCAYMEIARQAEDKPAALAMARRALSLKLSHPLHEQIFGACWDQLQLPRGEFAQELYGPVGTQMLALLRDDRTRLLELDVGYEHEATKWRADAFAALLQARKLYAERVDLLTERLARAKAHGPPNTPQDLLELRLEISATIRELCREDGHLGYLIQNLEAIPAEPQSLARATKLLRERGDHQGLAKLWCDQAKLLVNRQEGDRKETNERAADLWCLAAHCYRDTLDDPQRASEALEEARVLVSRTEVLDDLVEIYLSKRCENLTRAAGHLHRRLDLAVQDERLALSYRLAKLYLDIGEARQCQSVIDEVFDEAAPLVEFRRLYLKCIDAKKVPSDMLSARVRLSCFFGDPELSQATATASKLLSQIDPHEVDIRELLPLLEQSAPRNPCDLVLQKHFVTALSAAGRREDAMTHLEQIIAGQGRRRSPERAALHAILGDQFALSQRLEEAAAQFEKAALMNVAQSRRWIDVANLHERLGDLAASERALRTLLVHAQKREPSDFRTPTAAWVMLAMYRLDKKAGQEEAATRHWESCLELCMGEIEAAREVLAELAQDQPLHDRYLELAERMLDEDLAPDFKAEILAQRAEHLEQSGDLDGAFETLLRAISHDPAPQAFCAFALRLAADPEREKRLHDHLDRVLARADENQDGSATQKSQKLMALCTKARLCAKDKSRHKEIDGLLDQAQALEIRPIELLRTRHDVSFQICNLDMLRATLATMHAQGVLTEASLGDSWLVRAEQYATRPENFRLALAAVDEALASGVSRRHALDVMLAFPPVEDPKAHRAVLETMETIALELCDERALLRVLTERLEADMIEAPQLRKLHTLGTTLDREDLAKRAMEIALERLTDRNASELVWSVWAYIDLHLEDQEADASVFDPVWGWLERCLEDCEEASLRPRVTRVLERGTCKSQPERCSKILEALIEQAPTYAPYRDALWDLCQSSNKTQALLEITQRNLALLVDAKERADLRLRFVEATWEDTAFAQTRVEMLRAILTEDPGHARAQSLLVDHYRESGQLDELEALLNERLEHARTEGDTLAQSQLGLSLAKIYYDLDPAQGIKLTHDLLQAAPGPSPEISATCVQWLTGEKGGQLFATAFGHDIEVTQQSWGPYQSYLLDRYQEIIAHAEAGLRQQAGIDAAKLLEDAERVQEAIDLLCMVRQQFSDSANLETALIELYQRHDRHREFANLLLERASKSEDPDLATNYTIQAAQVYFEQLEDAERAVSVLDSLSPPQGSPLHYERLRKQVEYLGETQPRAVLERLEEGLTSMDELEKLDPSEASQEGVAELLGDEQLQAKRASMLYDLGEHERALVIFRWLSVVDADRYRNDWARCQSAHLDALIAGDDKQFAKRAWQSSVARFLSGEDADTQDNGARLGSLGGQLAALKMRDADFLQSYLELARHREDQEMIRVGHEWSLESEDTKVAKDALEFLLSQAIEAKDYERAQDYLTQTQETLGEDPSHLEHRKRVYHLVGNFSELAKIEYELAGELEDDQEASTSYQQAATWFEEADEMGMMYEALEQAVKRDPTDHALQLRLVDLDLEDNNAQKASERLDTALSSLGKGKEQADLVAKLAMRKSEICASQGDDKAQLEWLQKAHNASRNDTDIALALADLAETHCQWDLASRALRQLANIGEENGAPTSGVLCTRQAKLWRNAKDLRKASFWAHKARHADPESQEIRDLLEKLAIEQRQSS